MSKFQAASLFILVGLFAGGSCGKASLGFQAPDGSTVTLSESQTITLTQTQDVIFSATVRDSLDSPLNGIEVIITCVTSAGSGCDLYDSATGDISDASTLVLQTSSKFTTDSSGRKQLRARLVPPGNLGVTTYDATISADIHVDSKQTTITVE
ncbi:MAG: hypothetical protein V1798_01095 [Pseudomonadota bacterium]